MKKFQFSLNTVLSYKQQRLDLIQAEHAAAVARVREVEQQIADLQNQYQKESQEYTERCTFGISIVEARLSETRFRAIEQDMQILAKRLKGLKAAAEKKRSEVVEAKKEATSIEKLKEKKIAAYQKAAEKDAELLIDEFVSSVQATGANRMTGT